MTKSNSFAYFEDAVVSRTAGNVYKVVLEDEDVIIFKKGHPIDVIAQKTGEDENLIAILLAYIEYVRRSSAEYNKRPPRNIEDDYVIKGVVVMLEVISIDDLIEKIKSSKWHELVEIFESDFPVKNMMKQ